jgi:hypothetical protein
VVTVLKQGADNGNGDIFIAPSGGSSAGGPEIISNTGKVIWFRCLARRPPPGTGSTSTPSTSIPMGTC